MLSNLKGKVNMSVKINSLEIENIKRIKAIKLTPTQNGLTVIGGKNGQGKTSVLDSIAWALGGDRYRPSEPRRDGSAVPPTLHLTLSNGLVVERKGKNSDLKVIDPNGRKSGQQLLNEFVSQFAIDLPKFMEAGNKEKADILLQVIGVGNELFELERKENELYNRRHEIGRIADRKQKFADEMTEYSDVPDELISASELISRQQDILARNAENRRKREHMCEIEAHTNSVQSKIDECKSKLTELERELTAALSDLETARNDALFLQDESTAELEKDIADIEKTNIKIRSNLDKEKALDEAKEYRAEYNSLTCEIDKVREARLSLLDNAQLPLPGLSVENGELTYNGHKWDSISGSDRLKIATAIARKINPECGFVLLDKLEQMDSDSLREFAEWLEGEGLQVIATRVSTGDECSIIIEDGYVKEKDAVTVQAPSELPKWGGTHI